MVRKKSALQGFTLSELLIVILLVAIIAILGLLAYQRQTIKGFDVKRKADLARLRVVFEDYYSDHECYPQVATWNAYSCEDGSGGQFFAPYLQGQPIPCDPVTHERYYYITIPEDVDPAVSACSGYKLFAALGNLSDGDIPGSGCSPDRNKGCGYGPPTYPPPASFKYNYGISVGGAIANPLFDFSAPTPSPTPAYTIGDNFCLGNPNPEHACNTKAGLVAPAYGNRPCGEVLRELGCTSFFDGSLCDSRCKANFNQYACQQTSTVQCVQP